MKIPPRLESSVHYIFSDEEAKDYVRVRDYALRRMDETF